MSFLKVILIAAALFGGPARASEASEGYVIFGEGLPLPWPFPWAKECPVDWSSMQGRYVLSDSADEEEIDLDISVVERMGSKLVRVARYNRFGRRLAEGFAIVGENQRAIRLLLKPVGWADQAIWATIQLHYQRAEQRCSEDNLVPILTLEGANGGKPSQKQYVLLKVRNPR